jgi:hypothetical protein
MYKSAGTGRSVLSSPAVPPLCAVAAERHIMKKLCDERGLPLFYYEAALGLWMRVKQAYQCQACVHGPARYMVICLNLAIKVAGPAWTNFEHCTLHKVRKEWKYMTAEELQMQEIEMCKLLNWQFF